MQSIKFREDLYKQILFGHKTQTRRLIKQKVDTKPIQPYQPGDTVQAKCVDQKTTTLIEITSINSQNLYAISQQDLIAEGISYHHDQRIHMMEFVKIWAEIYGIDRNGTYLRKKLFKINGLLFHEIYFIF